MIQQSLCSFCCYLNPISSTITGISIRVKTLCNFEDKSKLPRQNWGSLEKLPRVKSSLPRQNSGTIENYRGKIEFGLCYTLRLFSMKHFEYRIFFECVGQVKLGKLWLTVLGQSCFIKQQYQMSYNRFEIEGYTVILTMHTFTKSMLHEVQSMTYERLFISTFYRVLDQVVIWTSPAIEMLGSCN